MYKCDVDRARIHEGRYVYWVGGAVRYVRCGAMRCGVAWRGVARIGCAVRCGAVRAVRCGVARILVRMRVTYNTVLQARRGRTGINKRGLGN